MLLTLLIVRNSEAWLNGYKFGFEILLLNGALILLGRERYDEAQEQYRLAQTRRPGAAAPVYGLAVVAARRKEEAAVGSFLKQAVTLDRSYAQRAVEDLEFQDYTQGKVFRDALR